MLCRLLMDNQSVRHLDYPNTDHTAQLKLRRAKELSKKKRLIDPEVQMPRDHWYEMKTPEFHLEARKNIKHLRMFLIYQHII